MKEYIGKLLGNLRNKCPLIHQITNYVTVNDCANITLAVGASPIMSDDISEVEEIVSIANALVINIGTLNERTIQSMILSGKTANIKGIPVVLDPVGVGCSKLRNETVFTLLKEVKFAVIRGNASEIKFLVSNKAGTRGVDVADVDIDSDNTELAKTCVNKYNCVVAITGAVDIVSDGDKVAYIENGHIMLKKITGAGCMCSALIGCYCGVTKNYFLATVAGVVSIGIAGEIASKTGGTGTFRVRCIDVISSLDDKIINEMARIK